MAGAVSGKGRQRGFTLLELLIVIVLAAMVLAAVLPVSYGMYENYTSAAQAQEVMAFISGQRRDSFLHGERKVLSSRDGSIMVDGDEKKFAGMRIDIARPVIFFRNGTSSGGSLELRRGAVSYVLEVKSPLGDLALKKLQS